MRSLVVMLVVVVGLACSSRPEHHDTTVGNGAPTTIDAAPPAAGCPATFAAASGACSTAQTCTYPDGVCSCAEPPWCGGMAPPPRPTVWNCTPNVRPDGCPGNQPADGATCSPDGKACDYSCSCGRTSTCTHGAWVNTTGPCVP